MSALTSYAFSFLFLFSSSILILLPHFNLHIAKINENRFLQTAREIIESKRLEPALIARELGSLDPSGIKIIDIDQESHSGYLVYRFQYSYENLFLNQFLSQQDLNSLIKTQTLIIDQVN